MANELAVTGLYNIIIVFICIVLAWWALKGLRFEVFLKDRKSPQGVMLQMLLAVVIGYILAKFFIDYLQWSMLLKWMI